jgi:beta-1,2-mannobiose phosphorylase / 1,2-beta-oligomannan phosphorylase
MYVVRRSPHNPLIAPLNDKHWEARGTFNPTVVKKGTITHLLYRALGKPDALMTPAGISTIGKALSLDGEKFQNRRQFIVPDEPWEKYGCEDPRVTYFEGKYYIFYTALGGMPFGPGNIKVAVAVSKDLETIQEKHLVTPFNAKAMTLFPERVNGKITAILTAHTDDPPARIAIVQCDKIEELWDLSFWERWHAELGENAINPLRFDHDHVEVGATPVKTKDGWLLFYSYIQNYFGGGERVFGIEALLLDLKDPRVITGRTKGPIMVPEEIYEKYGIVPNIVFPTGAILHKNNRLDLYYGAADTVCAKASLNLPDLLSALIPERRVELATRFKDNPILKPIETHEWEKTAVFNAAALDLGGYVHLLYRAMGPDNTSVIGHAKSKTGLKSWVRSEKPIYVPREDFEQKKGSPTGNSGCEDPRITKIGDTIYMAYTAYDGVHPTRVALTSISAKDFLEKKWDRWTKPILTTPDAVNDKDTALLPEKIGGQYMLLHRIDPQLCADFLDTLDFTKSRLTRCIEIMGPRPGCWDSTKIGIAGPPIKTPKGWLLIYHGVSKTSTYRLGAVLLDLKNPATVLSRSVDAILEPIEEYERVGVVRNAVFSCGAVLRGDTIYVYYGGADTVMCGAKVSLKKLLKILLPENLES